MSTITRATATEKADYATGRPVYPLYGFIKVDGHRLPVEDLRGYWPKHDPQYEIMAPAEMIFSGAGLHQLLCFTLADVRERVRHETLEYAD